MRDAQGLVGVLLHQKDRGAVGIDLLDDAEDLLDDDGRKAQGGLVEQEEPGPGHEGAAHGQHLLLAAGQGAALLGDALLQDGKELEDVVHVAGDAVPVAAKEGAEIQVLAHRELGEDEAPLGHLRDAELDDVVRRQLVDGGAVPDNFARARMEYAADGHERRGLACAVGADEGDYLPVVDADGDVLQGLDLAVVGVDLPELKHCRSLLGRP